MEKILCQTIVENAPFGCVGCKLVKNSDNQIEDAVIEGANKSFLALLGMNEKFVNGKKISETLTFASAAYRSFTIAVKESLDRKVNSFNYYSEEVDHWYKIVICQPDASSAILYTLDMFDETHLFDHPNQFFRIYIDQLDGESLLTFFNDNNRWGNKLGYSFEEFQKLSVYDIVHEDDIHKVKTFLENISNKEPTLKSVFRYRGKNKRLLYIEWTIYPSENELYVYLKDITEQRLIIDRHQMISENTVDVIWSYDYDEKAFIYFSPSITKLLGYQVDEVLNKGYTLFLTEFSSMEMEKKLNQLMKEFIHQGEHSEHTFEIALIHKDGSTRWVESSIKIVYNETGKIEFVGIARDIEYRKAMEKELINLANMDTLTNIYNRRYFNKILEEETYYAVQTKSELSLVVFDIDYFKIINDTWGHIAGDEVLKQLANIVRRVIRKTDIFCRIGGEEFAIIMKDTNPDHAYDVVERIRHELENNQEYTYQKFTCSFGIAGIEQEKPNNNLYFRADKAMYKAKNHSRGTIQIADFRGYYTNSLVEIHWRDAWNSEHEEIDNQHKKLVLLSNELMSLVLEQKEHSEQIAKIDELIGHIAEHFTEEEKIIKKVNFPAFVEHKAIHQQLTAKALRLRELFFSNQIGATAYFSFIIDDVVLGHMLEEDVKFFPYVKNLSKK